MKCKNCNSEIPDDSMFCEYCGTKVAGESKNTKKYLRIAVGVIVGIIICVVAVVVGTNKPDVRLGSEGIFENIVDTTLITPVEKSNSERENACKEQLKKTSQMVIHEGYVDLALPSGTLWKKENEIGYYTDAEISEFENNLPTTEQFGELVEHCSWIKTSDGYQVVGTNGNVIFLPAVGCKNIYSSVREQDAKGNLCYLTRNYYYFEEGYYDEVHKWVFVVSEGTLNYICSSPGESYSVRFVYNK